MLILTRRTQEALMIGDDITLTVLSVKGNQVRIGIDAPRTVEVHREEIYHRVKETGFKKGVGAHPGNPPKNYGSTKDNNEAALHQKQHDKQKLTLNR